MQKKLLPLVFLLVLGCLGAEASPFGHWAVRGVVVNKTFRATPLSHSLGVDGIYKLEVRDEKNKIHRQMVTRTLFLAYEIGDAFNPDGALPGRQEREQKKVVARIKEEARATLIAAAEPIATPNPRLVLASFPQDMLPETEGF